MLFILLTFILSLVTSEVPIIENGWYFIKNPNSNKYLQARDDQTSNTFNIEIGSFKNKNSQKWKITNLDNGYVSLTSALGGYDLDLDYNKFEDGTNIQMFYSLGGDAQQFLIQKTNLKNVYTIGTKVTKGKKVLDIVNCSTEEHANVQQWTNNNAVCQFWVFEKVSQNFDDFSYPFKNKPVPSNGCGKDLTIQKSGSFYFKFGNENRLVRYDLPKNYDRTKPYRLIFAMHPMGGTSLEMVNWEYYGLKYLDLEETTIFVAPEANGPFWQEHDYRLFDYLLEKLENELCIDVSRIFSCGFSYGSMFTNGLSYNHQRVLRAVATFAPADKNIWIPNHTGDPIAWMGVLGIKDDMCLPEMARSCRDTILKHNSQNGKALKESPVEVSNDGIHKCYNYKNVYDRFPVRWCTHKDGHIWDARDKDKLFSWVPKEAWDFFNQF